GALLNSFVVAAGAATLTAAFSAVVAWLVVRTTIPGRGLLDFLASLMIVFPGWCWASGCCARTSRCRSRPGRPTGRAGRGHGLTTLTPDSPRGPGRDLRQAAPIRVRIGETWSIHRAATCAARVHPADVRVMQLSLAYGRKSWTARACSSSCAWSQSPVQ